jgi:hypothetical protein
MITILFELKFSFISYDKKIQIYFNYGSKACLNKNNINE